MRLGAPLAVLGMFLLAGCAASEPAPVAKVLEAPAPPPPKATLLRVLVINDEYLPIYGASVRVVGLGLNATTDDVGNAYFHVAKSGRYSVHIHHARYFPNTSKIHVGNESDAVHRVTLLDAPDHSHFRDYRYFSGLCGPGVFASNLTGNGECPGTPAGRSYPRWLLNVGLTEARVTLEWEQTPVSLDRMRVEVRFPGLNFTDGSGLVTADGPSPVEITIPDNLFTDEHRRSGTPVEVHVGLSQRDPIAANVYQPFDLYAEFDYFVDAPDVDPDA